MRSTLQVRSNDQVQNIVDKTIILYHHNFLNNALHLSSLSIICKTFKQWVIAMSAPIMLAHRVPKI